MKLLSLKILIFLPLLLSCDLSQTHIHVIDIDDTNSSDNDIGIAKINLVNNSEFPRNFIDEIKTISIVGWSVNYLSDANEIELWISEDSTFIEPSHIRGNCLLIFESPLIQGEDSVLVNWSDGMANIRNFSVMKTYFENSENFFIYVLGSNTPFNTSIRVSFVITAIETAFH